MALKDSWNDKVNGKDIVDADDINSIARAVIELEENGGDQGVDGVTLDQIIDPDNNPIEEAEDNILEIHMELGGLSTETGDIVEREDAIRSADFISVIPNRTVFFMSSLPIGGGGNVRVCCYDANKIFIKTAYVKLNADLTISSNWRYIKIYRSDTGDKTVEMSLVTRGTTKKVEFQKIYFADHGYSIYGAPIDDETMHKLVVKAEGKDGNSYNIIEVKAPPKNPEEATIALMNGGNGFNQFVDFSSMVYDPDNPTVEIVCQTRGNQPLPEFSVRYNDGNGAGRVKKLVVMPDCIPIKLTNAGIEVRRNNNYNNNATAEELVTVNLADLYDKVNVIYDALIANGTITE